MRFLVEPARRIFVRHLPRWLVYVISVLVSAAMYPVVHTLYRLPIANQLPYYKFFLIFGNYCGAKTYLIPTTN